MKTTTKKLTTIILCMALAVCILLTAAACDQDAQTSADELDSKIQELEASLAAEKKASGELNDLLAAKAADLEAAEAELEATEAEKEDLGAKLDTLLAKLDTLAADSKVDELSALVEELQTSIGAVDAAGKNNAASLKELDKLLAQLKQAQANQKVLDAMEKAESETLESGDFSNSAYAKLIYIDANLSDRDAFSGADFKTTQKWITWTLMQAGYPESAIELQDFVITSKYYTKDTESKTSELQKSYPMATIKFDDKKFYNKSGKVYEEAEDGEYVKYDICSQNIVLKKQGKNDKQIIVGGHYDGDGTGDNGSGVAMLLTLAEKLIQVEQEYTVTFIFFSAEEYGCYGSTAYANAMTEEEIANTLYMINLDCLVCGDYAYIYGGAQEKKYKTETVTEIDKTTGEQVSKEKKTLIDVTVKDTEAYENALAVAEELGLSFRSNPWSKENPESAYDKKTGQYVPKEFPAYLTPSTGDWSDHKGFKNVGIKYLYCEAANWDLGPKFDGSGEAYLMGKMMNTSKDYLDNIEKYYPGRIQTHLSEFSQLLWALLNQSDVDF